MRYVWNIIFFFTFTSLFGQSPLEQQLLQYMDAQAEVNDFSGTVLVSKGDAILLRKAYGFADLEWNTETVIDTKYSLASVSKQFTAVAILQLAEKRLLSLEDRLHKYYPRAPKGEQISIEMLLTHTSGVSDDVEELFSSNTALSPDEVVAQIMEKPLLFEPGSQTAYSNTGYYLLATIIEKVSKETYAAYFRKHLFQAAGMLNSGVSSNDSIVVKMAKAYYHKNGVLVKNPFSNWKYNIGLDGVYSTVDDLHRWNEHLFNRNTLLSAASKEKMFTAYHGEDFGYGVLVDPFYSHDHHLIGHDGGFYGTQTSLNKYPDDEVFVTVLSNNQSPAYLLAYGLAAIVFGKAVELPYKHVKVSIDPSIYDKYVGSYGGVKIYQKEEKLYYSEYGIELIPESTTKFFRVDDPNRTVTFIESDNAKVDQIILTKAGVKEIKTRD